MIEMEDIMKITSNTQGFFERMLSGQVFDNPLTFITEFYQNCQRANAKNLHITINEDELKFSDEAISEVDELNKIIIEMFDLALIIFRHNDTDDLKKLHILEEKTDELSKSLAQNHYHRITQNSCSPELTSFYSELITELERVADHLTNIGYSIVDPIGDELE